MSDASRTRIPTEVWTSLLVIIGFTTCLLLDDTRSTSSNEERSRSTFSNKEPLKNATLSSNAPLIDLNNKSIPEAISILESYSRRAQQIIPFFPSFPKIWLRPPTEKGRYASLGERHCVEFLELLFAGHKFLKVRPRWLKNYKHNTGRCLELDAYCEALAIALEYNGRQHHEWPNFTGMTWEEFKRQQERDQMKVEVCIERNICLIRIPHTVPLERIPIAIYAKLLEAVPELGFRS